MQGSVPVSQPEGMNLVLSVLGCQCWGFCLFSFEENVCREMTNLMSVMVLSKESSKADSNKDMKCLKLGEAGRPIPQL